MSKPELTVTVILCSNNGEKTIALALDSVVSQSLAQSQYEIIVVDDGSTDGTSQVASTYAASHPHFRCIRSKTNQGLVAACNLGLESSSGKYVIRLDDDDQFDSAILDEMVRPLEDDETDLVYSDRYEVMIESGIERYIGLDEFNVFQMTAAGVMMRRCILVELGGYRPLFWEEYDLYMRYAEKSGRPFHRIAKPLYRYNRRPGSLTMTATNENRRKGWQELRDLWGSEALDRYGWDPSEISRELGII